MKKKYLYITLICCLFSLQTFSQKNDEYIMTMPGYTNPDFGKDTQVEDFSFDKSNFLDISLLNHFLWESAKQKALDEWLNRQKILIERKIEEVLNEQFSSYDEAQNAIFYEFEKINAFSYLNGLKSSYSHSLSSLNANRDLYVKGLKALNLRAEEIKLGKINESSYAYLVVGGQKLINITSLSQANAVYESSFENFKSNESLRYIKQAIRSKMDNMGEDFDNEITQLQINKKNSIRDAWEQLDYTQFLINYYLHRKTGRPIVILPPNWDKFGNVVLADKNFVENYAINNRASGYSVFSDEYFDKLLADASRNQNQYVDYSDMYASVMDTYRLQQENALQNWLNTKTDLDLKLDNLFNILSGLSINQKNWLYSHETELGKMFGFLNKTENNNNGVYTPEAIGFVLEALNALMNGGLVNYDDKIINLLTIKCAKDIFTELENGIFENHPLKPNVQVPISNPLVLNFSQTILKLFNDSDNTHLIIQNGDGKGSNAFTEFYTINIDESYLENATQLSIDRTIIHESVHAYLNGLYYNTSFRSVSFGMKLRKYAEENGYTSINNLLHHNFMAQYVNAMAYSLYEWDKEYGTGGNLGWEYYKSMAYGGMFKVDPSGNIVSESDSFVELVPNATDRQAIANIVLNENKGNNDAQGTKCD